MVHRLSFILRSFTDYKTAIFQHEEREREEQKVYQPEINSHNTSQQPSFIQNTDINGLSIKSHYTSQHHRSRDKSQ